MEERVVDLPDDEKVNACLLYTSFSPVLQAFKTEAERRGYDITFITHHMGDTRMTYLRCV